MLQRYVSRKIKKNNCKKVGGGGSPGVKGPLLKARPHDAIHSTQLLSKLVISLFQYDGAKES